MRNWICFCCVAIAAFARQSVGQDLAIHSMEMAWFENQQAITSGRFEVTSDVTMPRFMNYEAVDGSENELSKRDYQRKITFIFQGSELRTVDTGPNYYNSKSNQFETQTLEAFNTLGKGTATTWGQSYHVPIQLAFRMFDPNWFVFKSQLASQVGEAFEQDGLTCYKLRILTVDAATKKIRDRDLVLTVCPSRDFAVVGYDVFDSKGVNWKSVKMNHEFDGKVNMWIPKSWRVETRFNADNVLTEKSVVKSYELNLAIPERDLLPTLR